MAIWVILAVMTGAAVLLLLWPLSRRHAVAVLRSTNGEALAGEAHFYREQLREIARDEERGLLAEAEVRAARAEAARRLLRAGEAAAPTTGAQGEPALRRRRAASAFALSSVPLIALLAYGLYGSPDLAGAPAAGATRADAGGVDAMVAKIEAHLAAAPDDARGWAVLAPIYLRGGRPQDAARAYETLLRLQGEGAETLAALGEAEVMAADGVVPVKARQAFERANALDPSAAKPRFYLARAAEQDGNVPDARRRYAALVAEAPADAPWLPLVRESLARLDGGPAPASRPATPSGEAAASIAVLPPAERQAAIRSMVEGLDRRLTGQGGSGEEWGRLVRAYAVLGDRDRAGTVLLRARTALAGDPQGRDQVEATARDLGLRATVAEGVR